MAVTYIRRLAGDRSGSSAGGGITGDNTRHTDSSDVTDGTVFQRQCSNCKTTYIIDITHTWLQIDVAGPVCPRCKLTALDQKVEASYPAQRVHRPQRLFKVWLASQDRAAPRVEIRDLSADSQVAKRLEYPSPAQMELNPGLDQGPMAIAERRARWASKAEVKLGADAWHAVRPAWRGEYCDILTAVAEALDQIWATIRGGTSLTCRVVVRLQGLPEIVRVLVAEVTARSTAVCDRSPLPALADHLRQAGVVTCAATHCGACASLGAVVEHLRVVAGPAVATPTFRLELVERLVDGLNLPVFWEGRTMLGLEDAFRPLVEPVRPPEAQTEETPRPMPEGRLETTRSVIRETQKLDAVTRPLPFGNAEG
jgi:hypothetical protein